MKKILLLCLLYPTIVYSADCNTAWDQAMAQLISYTAEPTEPGYQPYCTTGGFCPDTSGWDWSIEETTGNVALRYYPFPPGTNSMEYEKNYRSYEATDNLCLPEGVIQYELKVTNVKRFCDGRTEEDISYWVACSTVLPTYEFFDYNCDWQTAHNYQCTCTPAPEACNGVDDNCNGFIDEGVCDPANPDIPNLPNTNPEPAPDTGPNTPSNTHPCGSPTTNSKPNTNVKTRSTTNIVNGNQQHSQVLFLSGVSLFSAGITFYYNSQDRNIEYNSIGKGWSHTYDISVTKQIIEDPDTSTIYTYALFRNGNGNKRLYTLSETGTYTSQAGDYSTLVENTDGTFVLTEKTGEQYNFSNEYAQIYKVTSITDLNNNSVFFTYSNDSKTLTQITDWAGRNINFAVDANGKISEITDPAGNIYTIYYSGGKLISIVYPDGGVWHYTYDNAKNYMLTKTNPTGYITTYTYEDSNSYGDLSRVVSILGSDGVSKTINYYPASTKTVLTDEDGGIWTYTYDNYWVTSLIQKEDPYGGVTTFTYDDDKNVSSITDPDGYTTSYTYDTEGKMTSVTKPDGYTIVYTYNGLGQVLTETDSTGKVITYTYDAAGNLLTVTDPTGATTTMEYDGSGNLTKIINALGKETIIGYDSQKNPILVTLPDGSSTTYTYDSMGRVESQTDGEGNTTSFTYDSRGRLLTATDPLGNTMTYSYDNHGSPVSYTDPNGNVYSYGYNNKGQVTSNTDPLLYKTTFEYNGGEKMTALIDANSNSTSFSYDLVKNLVSRNNPVGGITSYIYTPGGRLFTRTDAKGSTTTYNYDTAGRLSGITYPDSSTITYTYDARGNLVTAANQHITYTYTYDANGRMTGVTDSFGLAITYDYDTVGNRTLMVAPGNKTLSYIYDDNNRLTGIVSGADRFTLSYDAVGRRNSLAYPNGVTTTYSNDAANRLTGIESRKIDSALISSTIYTYDNAGNRLTNVTNGKNYVYQYDTLNRLVDAFETNSGAQEFYTYDPVGNRLASHRSNAYSHNAANQLLSSDGTTFTYDDNGNMTQKTTATGATTYTYDYENRLIQVNKTEGANNLVAAFKYGPFGRRLEKVVDINGTVKTTRYFYDNEDILFEYNENGAIGNVYIHGPGIDEPLALINGSVFNYYRSDAPKFILSVSNTQGNIGLAEQKQ